MDAEIKILSVENTELLKILCVEPRVGQNIALHATSAVGNSAILISALSDHLTFFSSNPLLNMK